jgi:putative addiction module CopG family antidote
MKIMQVELPDQLAREVETAVQSGRFENADEVVRTALRDFLTNRRFELLEQQQMQDITWALREQSTAQ